jgi:Fic family protein
MYTPNFRITNTILKNIGILEASREVILNAPLVPAWEAKFQEEAVIRTVHHGTHIEGNGLNYTEAAQIVAGNEIVGRERDIQEVLNYRNVLIFIDTFNQVNKGLIQLADLDNLLMKEVIRRANGKLNEEVILHIHRLTVDRILTPGLSGIYRKVQVVVKNSQTGEVTFRPPPAIEVPFQVRAFIEYINNTPSEDLHPALKAGIAHYELVRVHPFLDGNGRVSRAVSTLLLFMDGYDIKKFFSLEEHYDQDAMGYYMSLKGVADQGGDMTSWLEYFTQGLAIELTRVKEKVLSLSRDAKLKENLGGQQFALTQRQIKLIEYIQSIGFLQNKSFFELFPMVSEDTVLRELKDLIEKGIVKKEGSTKAARYVMTQ